MTDPRSALLARRREALSELLEVSGARLAIWLKPRRTSSRWLALDDWGSVGEEGLRAALEHCLRRGDRVERRLFESKGRERSVLELTMFTRLKLVAPSDDLDGAVAAPASFTLERALRFAHGGAADFDAHAFCVGSRWETLRDLTVAERERVRSHVDELGRMRDARTSRPPPARAEVVASADGQMLFRSHDAAAWIDDPAAAEAIRAELRRLHECSDVRSTFVLPGGRGEVVTLDGADERRYLVRVDAIEAGADDPLEVLTPTQRTVAKLAARGANAREIAAEIGCATGTVRVHMREIYRRLDVGSRVELVRLVAADAGDGE